MNYQLPLAHFENPPVSEVALSVEFTPLVNWRSPHAGIYWGKIIADYPNTEIQPPLPSQIEQFDAEFLPRPQIQVQVFNPDISRVWFLAEPSTRLIQVQKDRFILNWRKVRGDEIYPRYQETMRPCFQREWEKFAAFVSELNIGPLVAQQCELTYVNDIVRGEDWNTFEEALTLFSPWWGKGSEDFLPKPEWLAIAGSFLMPEQGGRLHFNTQRVLRPRDNKDMVQLTLTARGKPVSGEIRDILLWMDKGHDWIVRGFTDLTSEKAHKLWKRKP